MGRHSLFIGFIIVNPADQKGSLMMGKTRFNADIISLFIELSGHLDGSTPIMSSFAHNVTSSRAGWSGAWSRDGLGMAWGVE